MARQGMKEACFLHPIGKESKRIIYVNCCYNGKKFLKVLYLQNIYAISKKIKRRIILIFTSVFILKPKKIVCFRRITNLTIFICLIDVNFLFSFNALKEQDHSWTHFLRAVNSLLRTLGLQPCYFFTSTGIFHSTDT